jgi:predicted ester cyclase
MKKISITLFLLSMICACSQHHEKEETMAKPVNEGEGQINIVYAYIDAVLNKDFTAMDTMLAPNFMAYGPAVTDSVNKSQEIDSWKKEWAETYDSITYNRITTVFKHIDSGNFAGDWVSDWANITLKYKNGKTAKFGLNEVYKVVNSKIVLSSAYYDAAGIMKQLGYTFVPPKEAKVVKKAKK